MKLKMVLLALGATSCLSHPKTSSSTAYQPACPRLRADSSGATSAAADSLALERARKYPRFISIIVDGRRAAWNYPVDMMSENITFGVQRGDIKSMKGVDWQDAEGVYGVCPGVGLVLIETKSGNWQPPTSKSRE